MKTDQYRCFCCNSRIACIYSSISINNGNKLFTSLIFKIYILFKLFNGVRKRIKYEFDDLTISV